VSLEFASHRTHRVIVQTIDYIRYSSVVCFGNWTIIG